MKCGLVAEDKVVQQFAKEPNQTVYKGYLIYHVPNSQYIIYFANSGRLFAAANTIEAAHTKIDQEIQKFGLPLYSNPDAEGGRIYEGES
jgi:hypothetical protein